MARLSDVLLPVVIGLSIVVIVIASYIRGQQFRAVKGRLQGYQPETPLQVLEKRLASGEISAEEFQYERYLLDKKA